jgi:cellulose synthase/poly-beta-1,6-N-acetylglucosamine synthase-like glycosyltransferase
MEMTANDASDWNGFHTPVIFNHHAPLEINSSSISHIDLNPITSTPKATQNQERVLILTPLRDASPYLNKYFELLAQITYPHNLIDIAFLVGDSTDDTMAVLASELDRLQRRTDAVPFRSAKIVEKNFGVQHAQDVEDRHSFEAQGPRRKAIARARNYLLYTALQPEHSWVYWRDVDIVDSPKPIIQDMIAHDKDIIVPSMLSYHPRNYANFSRYLVSQI